MSLDESWDAYRARILAHYGISIPSERLADAVDYVEQHALREGQLRYGGTGDWFRSIRWSPAAWTALHGADGPRGRTRQAL